MFIHNYAFYMKKFFLLVFLFFPLSLFADNQFSDLDTACYNSMNGSTSQEKLILKHINGRITKSEWYVKYNDYLYIVANTFTDNYRFLGSYLVKYDCTDSITTRIAWPLKKNRINELGFIQYNEQSNIIAVYHAGRGWKWDAVWIYDLETEKLRFINYNKVKIPRGKKIAISVDYSTYNGTSVELNLLYYTGNYNYENYGSPDRFTYKF